MVSSSGIKYAIVGTASAIVVGAFFEGVVPEDQENSSLQTVAFETMVQAGLTGAALSAFGNLMRGATGDPIHEVMFEMGLFAAQPKLRARIARLSGLVSQMGLQAAQRRAGSSAMA